MNNSLLPINSSAYELALEATLGERIDQLATPLRKLWNPQECPLDLLPWLAWAVSVDTWDSDWTEAEKRAVVASSIAVHRKKGTPWAVKKAIESAGFGASILLENLHRPPRDWSVNYDSIYSHGAPWAVYRLILERPITNTQAIWLRKLVASKAPQRSHLASMEYTEVAFLHNGEIYRNGDYNHGAANG